MLIKGLLKPNEVMIQLRNLRYNRPIDGCKLTPYPDDLVVKFYSSGYRPIGPTILVEWEE